MRVKIFGAGSIGNHLANASRQLGWHVDICDIDEAALARTKNDIYPARYGAWDESIGLYTNKNAPSIDYDLVVIGTPPDSHIKLAIESLNKGAGAVLVEKPFCTPDLSGAQELSSLAQQLNIPVFVGYDHVVGAASDHFEKCIEASKDVKWQTLDVEFREYWGGIFAAHPWLSGPQDSYLGYWKRGGGSTCEHSHAINLWQHFAHSLNMGRVKHVTANLSFESVDDAEYDHLAFMTLTTETGFTGRVVQDVVTSPPRKWARAQSDAGFIEWHCSFQPGVDAVYYGGRDENPQQFLFQKTRPDDFIMELSHISRSLANDPTVSPLSMTRGLETMLVIAAAFKSTHTNRTVTIDYDLGFTLAALS